MENFNPISAAIGGILIGLSASLLMLLNGRIAGISGIVGQLLNRLDRIEMLWRVAFLVGLIAGGLIYAQFMPVDFPRPVSTNQLTLIIGGLLVGFGTAMGSGCTSGHGVCGISRFSLRSLLATVSFLCMGMLTVYLIRHILGFGL